MAKPQLNLTRLHAAFFQFLGEGVADLMNGREVQPPLANVGQRLSGDRRAMVPIRQACPHGRVRGDGREILTIEAMQKARSFLIRLQMAALGVIHVIYNVAEWF